MRRDLLPAVALLAALALAPDVRAAIIASAAPGDLTVGMQASAPHAIVWTLRNTAVATSAGAGTYVSASGQLTTAAGAVVQNVTTPLTIVVGANGTGAVLETFAPSPSTIAAALHAGANLLIFQRSFGAFTAQVRIHIAGSGSGALNLARVTLSFGDRSTTRVLGAGESVNAVAEITYAGNGLLQGMWEFAGPPSTLGEPVFVPLAPVSVNLSGGGLTELSSPPLPATIPGRYLARFSVREPVVAFSGLVIEYAVDAEAAGVAPIIVLAPKANAVFSSGTLFQWQAVPGAISYRLEFLPGDAPPAGAEPVSGMVVAASTRDAVMSALAQTHLEGGRQYQWRIVGLDAQGEVVARSALTVIRTM